MRIARGLSVAFVLVAGALLLSGLWQAGALPGAMARGPATVVTQDGHDLGDGEVIGGDVASLLSDLFGNSMSMPANILRVPAPTLEGPRRVGIQAGHWLTAEAAAELGARIRTQTGAAANGYTEWETNLDIAERVAAALATYGVVSDILPTTIPDGYLADAFVSLHSDGDESGVNSGFKMAHGSRRGLYEDALQRSITTSYAAATDLYYDAEHISRAMTSYYAFNWTRYRSAVAPHTPAVILEMGYMTNWWDRQLIVNEADRLARAIADGILKFLDAHPRETLLGKDLVVPRTPFRASPTPTPTP